MFRLSWARFLFDSFPYEAVSCRNLVSLVHFRLKNRNFKNLSFGPSREPTPGGPEVEAKKISKYWRGRGRGILFYFEYGFYRFFALCRDACGVAVTRAAVSRLVFGIAPNICIECVVQINIV